MPLASLRSVALLGCAATACGQPLTFRLAAPPWPDGEPAVLLVTDANGIPLGAPALASAGGAALLTVENAPDKLQLFARQYVKDHPDLARCGVRYGGTMNPLGTPVAGWASGPIEARSKAAITLTPEVSPVTPFDLRFTSPCTVDPVNPRCMGVHATVYDVGIVGYHLVHVAVLPDDRAIAGGSKGGSNDASPIVALTATGSTSEVPIPGRVGALAGLGFDPTRGVVSGVSDGGTLFEVDTHARLIAESQLGRHARALGVGLDGTAIVLTDDGAFELAHGATLGVQRSDVPATADTIVVVRRDRAVVLADGEIFVFDGQAWRSEYTGPEAQTGGPDRYSEPALVANAEGMALITNVYRGVLLRDEATHHWNALPPPFGSISPRVGAFLPGGALMVLGDHAITAIWAEHSWCPIQVAGLSDVGAVDLSADGHHAFAVTLTPSDLGAPSMLYFDL